MNRLIDPASRRLQPPMQTIAQIGAPLSERPPGASSSGAQSIAEIGAPFTARPRSQFPNQPLTVPVGQNLASIQSLSGTSAASENQKFLQSRERERGDRIAKRDAGIQSEINRANQSSTRNKLEEELRLTRDPVDRGARGNRRGIQDRKNAGDRRLAIINSIAALDQQPNGQPEPTAADLQARDAQLLQQQTEGQAGQMALQAQQQKAALMQQISQLGPDDPRAQALRANYLTLDGRDVRTDKPSIETFSNPVDETDTEGRPIRAQYGNLGTRRLIEGVRPMPKTASGLTVGPDGALTYSGTGSPKLTEQQSKDLVYFTRGQSAIKNMGESDVLADPIKRAGASVPLVGNALPGGDYQKAEQAGREFLAAILRKDTGAAITNKEMEFYGKTYLPQPFDTPEVLDQKAAARRTALDAIRSGMGPAQMLAPLDSPTDYSALWE